MNYTTEQLVEIARQHEEHFTSITNWNSHAKLYNLPLDSTYRSRFGSWPESHVAIFGKYEIPKIYRKRSKREKAKHSKSELIQIARKNKEYFTTRNVWTSYAKEHSLPIAVAFNNCFGSWRAAHQEIFGIERVRGVSNYKKYSKDDLKEIAVEHKEHFTTKDKWTNFARVNGLPSCNAYVRKFITWKDARKEIFEENEVNKSLISNENSKDTKSKLISLAVKYRIHFQSALEWDKFSSIRELPTSYSYIKEFGDWETALKEIFGTLEDANKDSYSINELAEIAKNHKKYFYTPNKWDVFALKNDLPLSHIYTYYFGSWQDCTIYLFDYYVSSQGKVITKEHLITLAKRHSENFTTIAEWDKYAQKNNLPRANVYELFFEKSWVKARKAITSNDRIYKKSNTYKWTREEVIKFISTHSEEFTSLSNWTTFVKDKDGPSAHVIITNFGGTWNKAKVALGFTTTTTRKYTDDDLIEIAKNNISYFDNSKQWDIYASKNQYPTAYTYKKRFKSWSLAKELVKESMKPNS